MNFDVDFSVPFRHRVRFTSDLAGREFETLTDLVVGDSPPLPPKVLLVVDQGLSDNQHVKKLVRRLDGCNVLSLLDGRDFSVAANDADDNGQAKTSPAFFIMGGEICKNDSDDVEQILAWVNRFELDRRSYIIAIGGGALLDCVGFAAATAHRGIRLIRIPTTTLAQADSGVGVKNAINYFNKKNWLGTFAVPWAVVNDASLLSTLSERDFTCGFSEAIKVALLKSKRDFRDLCKAADRIRQRDPEASFDAIQRSCRSHLAHITAGGDPFEMLEARPLDFGHWSAHKLESLTEYRLRHGEAVAMGVLLDCIYSSRVHGLPRETVAQVLQFFRDLGLPLWHEALTDDSILQGLEEFRQHLGGRLTVTMLEDVERPINVHEIDRQQMQASIQQLCGLQDARQFK
jgi:3-dehydroquinate synthase